MWSQTFFCWFSFWVCVCYSFPNSIKCFYTVVLRGKWISSFHTFIQWNNIFYWVAHDHSCFLAFLHNITSFMPITTALTELYFLRHGSLMFMHQALIHDTVTDSCLIHQCARRAAPAPLKDKPGTWSPQIWPRTQISISRLQWAGYGCFKSDAKTFRRCHRNLKSDYITQDSDFTSSECESSLCHSLWEREQWTHH